MAAAVVAAPADAVVVNDVPLLVESGMAGTFGCVVVVLADVDLRIARLARYRGMTADEARARIAAQATDEQRRAVADVIIENNGSEEELRAEVEKAWRTTILPRLVDERAG